MMANHTFIENVHAEKTYRFLLPKNQLFWNCYYGQFGPEFEKVKQIDLLVKDRTNVVVVILDIKCLGNKFYNKFYWYKLLIPETLQVVWFSPIAKFDVLKC